jgi:hypothetical protein
MEIGPADSAGVHPQERLTGTWRWNRHVYRT